MSTSDDIGGEFERRNTLVAEYVLGVLSAREHERIGRLIENDQALRAERDFWISRFSELDGEYAEARAPDHVLGAIERRVFGDISRTPAAHWWDSLLVWRGIAAGALAV
ncbi:MAG TPA: anti-sigma factor, partial [Devosia sp.]